MIKTHTKKPSKFTKGGRNLIVLGIVSSIIALGTTGISLAIYHNTGDIYLDRSRPGFLPDQTEIAADEEKQEDEDYTFEKSGKLTAEILDEYLEKLEVEVRAIDTYSNAFDEKALSNEALNIPNDQIPAEDQTPTE